MIRNNAQVISLVPSWTETLISANVNVVGRTRFCIHPAGKTAQLPSVGGTKGFDFHKILALRPDFVILDREENKKEMAQVLLSAGIRILVSEVTNLEKAAQFLFQVGQELNSVALASFGDRYLKVIEQKKNVSRLKFLSLILVEGNWNDIDFNNFEYVIWKDPYMVIGLNTFIADVLSYGGVKVKTQEKYPEISESRLIEKSSLLSTEPYPFQKEIVEMRKKGFKTVLVDGEKISWYGIRNLLFLESCLK